MSSMEVDVDVPDFLREARMSAPESLQGSILQMEDLWERRLWHQLTLELEKYFNDQQSMGMRMRMFKDFVGTFEKNINQLKLVGLALLTVQEITSHPEGLKFMESVVEKVNTPATQDAYAYAVVETASIKLSLHQYEEVRKELDSAGKIIDNFDTIENSIHAAYYRVNAQYYSVLAANEEALTFKYKSDYQNYYRNALLYLACLPEPSPLSQKEAQNRAYELSIAALLSDKTYNFGELLLHPILNELQNTGYDWLRDLLFAMNAGDLDAFHKLEPRIPSIGILNDQSALLREKIHTSALLALVFSRPPHSRTLEFSLIAHECRLNPSEVEILIMKAFALGLIRGTIDQVDELVHITWMQGRVLDRKGVEGMKERLEQWSEGVNALEGWVYRAGQGVWVK